MTPLQGGPHGHTRPQAVLRDACFGILSSEKRQDSSLTMSLACAIVLSGYWTQEPCGCMLAEGEVVYQAPRTPRRCQTWPSETAEETHTRLTCWLGPMATSRKECQRLEAAAAKMRTPQVAMQGSRVTRASRLSGRRRQIAWAVSGAGAEQSRKSTLECMCQEADRCGAVRQPFLTWSLAHLTA